MPVKIIATIAFLLALIPFTISANSFESFELPFKSKNVYVKLVTVEGNVEISCNQLNQKVGGKHYRKFGLGCAYRSISENPIMCVIVVGKQTNQDILGHEFRHCILGPFHEE